MRNFLIAAAFLVFVFLAFAGVGYLFKAVLPDYFLVSDPKFIDYVLEGQFASFMVASVIFCVWVLSTAIPLFDKWKGKWGAE